MLIRKINRWSGESLARRFWFGTRPRRYRRLPVLRFALVTGSIANRQALLANLEKFEIEHDTSVVDLPAPQYLIAEWDAIVR